MTHYTESEFAYILKKIEEADILTYPFPHLDIKNFLSDEHLKLIENDKQIHFEETRNIDELHETLITNGWSIQHFPGCTNSFEKYKEYLTRKNYTSQDPVENIGITYRLNTYKNQRIKHLLQFMNSTVFHTQLKKKFNISKSTSIVSAIQKNLSGYEISPHPDIRQKCLTYLLNINKNKEIESLDCHTHLLTFKQNYKHIEQFWIQNKNTNRCWVPWDWCNTIKTMNENNSMVIFHPDDSPPTLHAIRLKYNHLQYQRTQIYGNLMYENPPAYINMTYTEFRPSETSS